MKVVEVNGLFKYLSSGFIGRTQKGILRGISLSVEKGEFFGILGSKRAGKTALLSILSTLLFPDRGSVRVLGMDVVKEGEKIRKRINMSDDNVNFPSGLTVFENLNFYAMLYGLSGKDKRNRMEEAIEAFELKDYRNVPFDRLSVGTKRRFCLAKSLLNTPELLLLDEPTMGLDPDISIGIRKEVNRIYKEKNITIILTTQYMKEAEELCTGLAFLKDGMIITKGFPKEVRRNLKVGDVIKITFSGSLLTSSVQALPGVINCSIVEDCLAVTVDNKRKRLQEILGFLRRGGTHIKEVSFADSDLEDIHLELAR